MKRFLPAVFFLAAAALLLTPAGPAWAQASQPERWLHVRVESREAKGELVRVNVPLTLAEKVLPTIHNDRLRDGKIVVDRMNVEGVDLHALLDAVRTTRDGEFVTIQGTKGEVRVLKQAGYLLVRVRETKDSYEHRAEIRVPMTVVEALLSSGQHELDLLAAIRALAAQGDTELVTVKDDKSTVRIWLDSKSTAE